MIRFGQVRGQLKLPRVGAIMALIDHSADIYKGRFSSLDLHLPFFSHPSSILISSHHVSSSQRMPHEGQPQDRQCWRWWHQKQGLVAQ